MEYLMDKYHKLLSELEKERLAEPGRKRNAESRLEYQCWVDYTHGLRDELNDVADAIRKKTVRNGEFSLKQHYRDEI